MMRKTTAGSEKFCYGLFLAALCMSGLVGMLVIMIFGDMVEHPSKPIWAAAAIGGNLGPLIVHILWRQATATVNVKSTA